jgi:TetR/AcrR family transcriptional regulator, ethionamide resistance regulator
MSGQPPDRVDRAPAPPLPPDRPRKHTGGSEAEHAILDATERLLGQTSLHELSVAQIIESAGISRATFYFYFSSKFAVLTALVERAIAEILSVSRQVLDRTAGLPTAAAMRQRIEASAGIWDANRAVLQATVENWNSIPELRVVWLRALDGLTDALAAEIDRERARGRAPAGAASRALASTLVWTTERCLYVAALSDGTDLDAVEALTAIWLGAMYGGKVEDGKIAAA